MPSPVKLYVYELSNGMVRAMSMQLVGRQIDGIWHTSVVVFNKEIFYGHGIHITPPGRSHHGQPQQILDMGETALDEQIFEEYLAEMRGHYTADKYHLLDFNCNSFTDDCIGFLTGGSIPPWIKDLPSDFLSTPFGAALRPTIDSMFGRSTTATVAQQQSPTSSTPASTGQTTTTTSSSSSLLQTISDRATSAPHPRASPALVPGAPSADSGYSTPSGPIHASTDPASFRSLLASHRAVVAMFTSATCGPCRMIEPVFEELAREKAGRKPAEGLVQGQVAFAKVDLGVGMGSMVAREYSVTATPTFAFFLDGKRIHELKGVNATELRTQVDLLLYQAFPPHPHASLELPSVSSVSTEPILFAQVPALDTVHDKLVCFLDATLSLEKSTKIKNDLAQNIFPWLKQRYVQKSKAPPSSVVVAEFGQITATLVADLPAASMFPLFDIWRLAILEPTIAQVTLTPFVKLLTSTSESVSSSPRATLLTLLRLTTNALGTSLSRSLLAADARARAALTSVLVQTLLHSDRLVRVAAASLAFNVGAWVQKGRVARFKGEEAVNGIRANEEDGEWEAELVSAVAEALRSEEESEDAVHRLTATLAFLIRLSPFYQDELAPLLGVLQVGETLKSKLDGKGKLTVRKKEIRALVEEVADRLCMT
ncbi:PPPDE putative peptidase domain-containing protein [Russula dissimulans]|nr:PPPDE putative peptidase domain-containing protein [Russula dissimulans]